MMINNVHLQEISIISTIKIMINMILHNYMHAISIPVTKGEIHVVEHEKT